jgi:hypothetical protein
LKQLGNGLKPAVVLTDRYGNLTPKSMLARMRHFEGVDDVYTSEFGKLILLQRVEDSDASSQKPQDDTGKEFPSIKPLPAASEQELLPEGPYFLLDGAIHQAWKLYPDHLDAFIETVVPDDTLNPLRYVQTWSI